MLHYFHTPHINFAALFPDIVQLIIQQGNDTVDIGLEEAYHIVS